MLDNLVPTSTPNHSTRPRRVILIEEDRGGGGGEEGDRGDVYSGRCSDSLQVTAGEPVGCVLRSANNGGPLGAVRGCCARRGMSAIVDSCG